MNQRLIVFTRYPEPGKAKRRLIPALGRDGAAELHRAMTRHTLGWARQLAACRAVDVEVRYDGGDERLMGACFGTEWTYRPQGEGDLGARMARAIEDAGENGADRTVLVGTDCPALTATLVADAFGRPEETHETFGSFNRYGQRPARDLPWQALLPLPAQAVGRCG